MSKITIQEVEHVAKLARLEFDEKEKEILAENLEKILEYIDKLNKLDTDNVPPTSHVIPVKNVMRPDVEKTSLSVEDALANAPSNVDGMFEVPKIIE